MRRFLAILLIGPALIGCRNTKKVEPDIVVSVPDITHHNYFEIEEYAITIDQSFSIDYPEYYLYFYSPTCNHCAELKDWIIEKAIKSKNIFFIKASEKDVIKNDVSSTIGAENVGDICILGYPTLIKIINKKIVNNVAGKTKIQLLLEKL